MSTHSRDDAPWEKTSCFLTFFFNTVIATLRGWDSSTSRVLLSLLASIILRQPSLASSSKSSSVYTLLIVLTFWSQTCRRRSLKVLSIQEIKSVSPSDHPAAYWKVLRTRCQDEFSPTQNKSDVKMKRAMLLDTDSIVSLLALTGLIRRKREIRFNSQTLGVAAVCTNTASHYHYPHHNQSKLSATAQSQYGQTNASTFIQEWEGAQTTPHMIQVAASVTL